MNRCVIISGGDFSALPELRAGDYIIACDRGYEYALRMGVTPELIIGDFDSYTGNLPEGVPAEVLPCEKDDTDTMHAVKYALEHGFGEIVLTCALGGRLDHTVANIQSCAYAAGRGASVSVFASDTDLYFLQNGNLTLPEAPGRSLSLFSLTERCVGVDISGVKYPLTDAELTYAFPLGVSNEWTSSAARISVEQGLLMIVTSMK